MTEQVSQINYSPEEESFLKAELPKLTNSEYNELMPIWGVKNPDEVEQMMYGSFTAKTIGGL